MKAEIKSFVLRWRFFLSLSVVYNECIQVGYRPPPPKIQGLPTIAKDFSLQMPVRAYSLGPDVATWDWYFMYLEKSQDDNTHTK